VLLESHSGDWSIDYSNQLKGDKIIYRKLITLVGLYYTVTKNTPTWKQYSSKLQRSILMIFGRNI